MLTRLLTAAIALTLSLPAFAATPAGKSMRHDARQGAQKERIQEGVKSGELTKAEAAKARADQRKIQRAENRAQADGKVTGKEKAKLEHMQDKASADIARQKHDGQKRPRARK